MIRKIKEIEVGSLCTSPYLSCFVIELDTMYGDGDGYGKIELVFKNEEDVIRAVNFLSDCFFDADSSDEILQKYPNILEVLGLENLDDWPTDSQSGMFHDPYSLKIFYYNMHGQKNHVNTKT